MKNKFQSLFFTIFIICGGFSLFASNILMKLFPTCGYIILILLLPLNLIIALLLSNRKIIIKDIVNSKLLSILLIIYLLVCGYFTFFSYLNIINDYYYPLTSRIVIFLILALACHFFASFGIKNIIKVGFVISFIAILLYFFNIFSETKYDVSLLRYDKMTLNNYQYIFSPLFIFLDGFLLAIFMPSIRLSKSRCFIYILLVTLIVTLFILENYLFYPSSYFSQVNYPYLLKYYTYRNSSFLEHLDINYLICTSIFTIFHYSIQIEIFRIVFKAKRKSKFPIVYSLCIFIAYLFTDTLYYPTTTSAYVMLFLSIILLLFFIILLLKKKVRKNVKVH